MAENKGGAPLGNNNGGKGKPWTAAIERALKQRTLVARKEALDELAEKLLSACDDKDMTALKELGDRLEGKPKQYVESDTHISGELAQPERPTISREEWLKDHGVG